MRPNKLRQQSPGDTRQVSWLAGLWLGAAFPVSQWRVALSLTAYSCGGSHGIGPDWVVLTVFPFGPLGLLAVEAPRLVSFAE